MWTAWAIASYVYAKEDSVTGPEKKTTISFDIAFVLGTWHLMELPQHPLQSRICYPHSTDGDRETGGSVPQLPTNSEQS